MNFQAFNFRTSLAISMIAISALTLQACGDSAADRQAKIQAQQQKLQEQTLELQQKQLIAMQEQQLKAQQEAIRQAESGFQPKASQANLQQAPQNAPVAQNYGQPAPTPQVVVQSAPSPSNSGSSAGDALLAGAVGAAAGALAMNAYRDSKVQPIPSQNSSLNGSYSTGANPYKPSTPVQQPAQPVYSKSIIGSKVQEVKPEVKPEIKAQVAAPVAPAKVVTPTPTVPVPAPKPVYSNSSYSSVKQSAPVYSSSFRSSSGRK